jgi:predicted regulator of Ras-like GTPase activity (Roadblock/LC7/MglB family)
MSAIASSRKSKFVGFLKHLLGKPGADPAPSPTPRAVAPSTVAKTAGSVKTASAASPAPPNVGGNGHDQGHGAKLQIPLPAIIATLPMELRSRVTRQADLTDLTVPVALDRILSQLGRGVVKTSFGEIRRTVPHIFSNSTSCDHVEVMLPLGEILTRIDPALLARRSAQKQVNVPADIISPFGGKGQGLVISAAKPKAEPVPAAPVVPAAPATARAQSPLAPPPPAAPARPPSPLVPPPSAVPDQFFKRAPQPAKSGDTTVTPVPTIVPPALAKPAPAAPPMKPVISTSPPPPPRATDFLSAPPVPRAVRPAGPTPAAPAAPGAPDDTSPLAVALSSVAEGWPEAVRQEIVRLNLTSARVLLPVRQVETALRNGRVVFSWNALRAWLQPAAPPQPSAYDATELELPLSVLAPLFLARQKTAAKSAQRVAIDDTIPNLFFGLPQAEPVSAPPAAKPPVNKVVDTNYYVWDDVSETARVDETEFKRKLGAGTGTDFVAKYATPNEIVSRAAALDGVAGALIALPDGLMVASRIPPDLNGDTLAAFLPQIFAKVSQTTRELRMGELNNLHFTVGNVPWKIFRVNAIFFAAFGRVGEALPTGPLAALAAELDHKNR